MIVRHGDRPKLDSKAAQRQLVRFLAPDLKEFAEGLLSGSLGVGKVTAAISTKLAQVSASWAERGVPQNLDDLAKMIPVERVGGFARLPEDVVAEILQRRKSGQSRRQIAQALRRPTQSVHNVLKREGDPAPEAMKARELEIKRRTIARLQAQLDSEQQPRRRSAG